MTFRPRLVPAVIVAATVLLGIKVSDIVSIGGADHALAAAPSPEAPAIGAPIDLTKAKGQTAAPSAATTSKRAAGATAAAAAPAEGAAKSDTQADAWPGTGKSSAQTTVAAVPTHFVLQAPLEDPAMMSPAEIKVLQELAQRRKELDRRASQIDQQQVVLEAAEKRVDQKIAELKALRKSIDAEVAKENAVQGARLHSLVKIYQAMKPGDAAQILSQLEMPIVIELLSHMKEAKTAPILAAMNPTKAEAITTALAERQMQPSAALAAVAAASVARAGP